MAHVKANEMGPLGDGGRVVIIGGGPGGVGCALALERMATEKGRHLDITILEGKQFFGERHHNLCAGVLSPPLPELLVQRLGVPFPRQLDRGKISGYILHTPRDQVPLDDDGELSVAVRRIQFDDYMLQVVRHRNISVLPARAVDLDFHPDRVLVYSESIPLEADVVVGAFGMDEGSGALFARVVGYRPPAALASVITRYHPSPESMAQFGQHVHAFLGTHPRIEFGAVTPKGNHLTINIAGETVDDSLMRYFLDRPEVRTVLPDLECAGRYDPGDMRFFKGRFPCSLAHHYYGNRFVLVGDAAGLVRAFKGKGVTSALQTGIRAAEAIMRSGISEQAFADDYAVANRDITGDLAYGMFVRRFVSISTRLGLLDPVLRAARPNAAVRRSLFGAVSGEVPYRRVLSGMLNPGSIRAVAAALARR